MASITASTASMRVSTSSSASRAVFGGKQCLRGAPVLRAKLAQAGNGSRKLTVMKVERSGRGQHLRVQRQRR